MARKHRTLEERQLVLQTEEGHPFIDVRAAGTLARLHIDESGVGGTLFDHLTIGILYNPRPLAGKDVERVFKRARDRWFGKPKKKKQIPVLKASSTPQDVRSRIIHHLVEIPDMAFVAATILKPAGYEVLEDRIYTAMVGIAVATMRLIAEAASIELIWTPGPNKLNANVFVEAYSHTAEAAVRDQRAAHEKTRIVQVPLALHEDPMLRAVDFLTNALWRFHERQDQADAETITSILKANLFYRE